MRFEVFFKHSQHRSCVQHRSQGLVLAVEQQPHHAIPLLYTIVSRPAHHLTHSQPHGTHHEVDRWRWVLGLDAHNARLNLRWRAEIVAADFHQLVDLCQELCVHAQPAVQVTPRPAHTTRHAHVRRGTRKARATCSAVRRMTRYPLGAEAERKLLLEHHDGTPKQGAMGQQLEHDARRNLHTQRHGSPVSQVQEARQHTLPSVHCTERSRHTRRRTAMRT